MKLFWQIYGVLFLVTLAPAALAGSKAIGVGALTALVGAYLIYRWLAAPLQALEALVANIPEPLVMTNLRGEILYINEPALQILGAQPEDMMRTLSGQHPIQLNDPDRFRMRVQQILKHHTQSDTFEVADANGAASFYKTSVTMFSAPGGTRFGVLLFLQGGVKK